MPRYKLRTLMILMAIGPIIIAFAYWAIPRLLELYDDWRHPRPWDNAVIPVVGTVFVTRNR